MSGPSSVFHNRRASHIHFPRPAPFWEALKAAAAQERVPLSNLIGRIDANGAAVGSRAQ